MEFSSQQFMTITTLADGIIPRTLDVPAASDLGVQYMFASIAAGWNAETFMATANALDVICEFSQSVYGRLPQDLDDSTRETLTSFIATSPEFLSFWKPFRLLVTINFYALPPAQRAIGMPGPSIDLGGLTAEGFHV